MAAAITAKEEWEWAHRSIMIAFIASRIPAESNGSRRIYPHDFNPYKKRRRRSVSKAERGAKFYALHEILRRQQGDDTPPPTPQT